MANAANGENPLGWSLSRMPKALCRWTFVHASRMLRRTPLRQSMWVIRLHDRLFQLLRVPDVVKLKDFVIHVDPRDRLIAKKLALYGEYEPFEAELLRKLAVPGSVAVDIGANIGWHTLILSRAVGAGG